MNYNHFLDTSKAKKNRDGQYHVLRSWYCGIDGIGSIDGILVLMVLYGLRLSIVNRL